MEYKFKIYSKKMNEISERPKVFYEETLDLVFKGFDVNSFDSGTFKISKKGYFDKILTPTVSANGDEISVSIDTSLLDIYGTYYYQLKVSDNDSPVGVTYAFGYFEVIENIE